MTPFESARALFEEGWNEQDFINVRRVLADELPFHIGGDTRTTNAAELEAVVARWHAAFPDLRFDVHSITSGDDVVAVRATLHGTQRGPWCGRQATGRSIEVEHAFFLRMEDGVIAEVWEILDRSVLDAQLTAHEAVRS